MLVDFSVVNLHLICGQFSIWFGANILGNLSTRRFLGVDGNRRPNLLPVHVSRRHGQPSRLCADFILLNFDVACKT